MKDTHSCLSVLQGDSNHQPCDAANEEDERICSHSTPQILVFLGLAAFLFVQDMAALGILRTSPSEVWVTCIFVAIVNTGIAIISLVLTMLGLFVVIATKIPRRFIPAGPTTIQFLRDTFRIGMALTIVFSVGGMVVSMLLVLLTHPGPRPLEMIAVQTLFDYYVAVFALLWLLQKRFCVSV
jgi:hypothetical protein